MEEEIDSNVIKATQLSLGKHVKRPPLSEKLLRKPPFRFLHDIVTSVLKNKGFFEGLFEENELISDNVKERESKIQFLNKVILVVSLTTGESLSVKPSKIVAGQEPMKTNQLLQCLARALDQNLTSDAAVKQFKAGIKIPLNSDKKSKESVKKNTDSKKLTSKSSEKLVINEKNAPNIKSKNKKSAVYEKESPPKKPLSKVPNKKPPEKSKEETTLRQIDPNQQRNKIPVNSTIISAKKSVPDSEEVKLIFNQGNAPLDQDSSLDENNLQSDSNLQENLSNSTVSIQENHTVLQPNVTLSPTTTDKSISTVKDPDEVEINKESKIVDYLPIKTLNNEDKLDVEENKKIVSDRQQEMNNITEFIKESSEDSRINIDTYDKNELNNSVLVRPSSVRPSSSRPGAPRLRDKSDNMISDSENILVGKVNIISENTLQEEDEDTSIIVENQTVEEYQEMLQNQEHNSLVNNQNSHLVQQILDSQKEYSQASGKTEIEWQFGVQKTSDVFIQEIEQLKFNVQALSRIANPLGKLLDHIQEDVEVMRQELQQWTKLYEDTSKDLIKQKIANEESLLPFHTKIKQLTMEIVEKREKISDLKVSIHKNASRIEKLLASGNVQ